MARKMNTLIKKTLFLIGSIVLVVALAAPVFAEDLPDLVVTGIKDPGDYKDWSGNIVQNNPYHAGDWVGISWHVKNNGKVAAGTFTSAAYLFWEYQAHELGSCWVTFPAGLKPGQEYFTKSNAN